MVLIWEKNVLQAKYLAELFRQAGFNSTRVTGYLDMRKALGNRLHQRTLVVMGLNKDSQLKHFNSLHRLAPLACILVISSNQDLQRSLDCYQAGADAYIMRPIQPDLLMSQCRSLLAQIKRVSKYHAFQSQAQIRDFGPIQLDFDRNFLILNGQEAGLTRREFGLLHYLCQHTGQVLSRERLYDLFWPAQTDPRSRRLDNLVLKLRQYLASCEQIQIIAQYGQGFMLQID